MFEANGDRAELFAGYQRAADVRGWRVVKREQELCDPVTVLTGRLERVDRFWISRANVARLRFNKCFWVWDQAEVITLDPLEVWLYHDPRAVSIGRMNAS